MKLSIILTHDAYKVKRVERSEAAGNRLLLLMKSKDNIFIKNK